MASRSEELAAVPTASPGASPNRLSVKNRIIFPGLDSAHVIVELFLYEPGAPCVEIQLLGDGDLVAVVLLHPIRGVDVG